MSEQENQNAKLKESLAQTLSPAAIVAQQSESDIKKHEIKLTAPLVQEQFRALVTQQSDIEKHIWQIPLAIITGVGVMFGVVARLIDVPEYGLHILIVPAFAGITILIYGVITLCRMIVGRKVRKQNLDRLLRETNTENYLVESDQLKKLKQAEPTLIHRIGAMSLSRASFVLLIVITVVLVGLLTGLCFQ